MKIFIIFLLAAAPIAAQALTAAGLDGNVSATDLARNLTEDSRVTFTNARYTGAGSAAGTFTGGVADGLDIDAGIILSTGQIIDASGPNNAGGKTFTHNGSGDADLDGLAGAPTQDAATLEFDFIPAGNILSFRYIFASEEYNEFVNTGFNDVFGFFLDGVNLALVPASSDTVSINTINASTNASLFNDNSFSAGTPFGTQFDGFTAALQVEVPVTPQVVHHMKLVIADANDTAYDSAVFIEAGSFTTPPPSLQNIPTLSEWAMILLAVMLLLGGMAQLQRRRML
ncbi:MAG: IPTL-CTERM sorting domain-containing protein [Gammaproteobacteria bacterium]|nr:IPTL-CTERM sorting domain-containing protein [Gammaproteobacteria bacterium]